MVARYCHRSVSRLSAVKGFRVLGSGFWVLVLGSARRATNENLEPEPRTKNAERRTGSEPFTFDFGGRLAAGQAEGGVMTVQLKTLPYWIDSAGLPRFGPLTKNEHADVVVVGGGITGLTAAYLLLTAGHSVVLLERRRIAESDT